MAWDDDEEEPAVSLALRTRRRGRVREEARVAVEAHRGELWVERTEGDVRDLWCHGMRYVRHARGWYAYGVRAVRTVRRRRTMLGASGASCPVPLVRV